MASGPDSRYTVTKPQEAQVLTIGFSLGWLLAANLVGLLLAAMLIWPGINSLIQPFTYGRWIPLHMDWQLYGWCSLPCLGLILIHYLDTRQKTSTELLTVFGLWSFGLIVSGIQWLNGGSTGKPFLNWGGFSGLLFAVILYTIWFVLAKGWFARFRNRTDFSETHISLSIKLAGLGFLAAVPIILLHTSNPEVYPPVNPSSGGATGHSLLASTLSLVLLMGALPGGILGLQKIKKRGYGPTVYGFWILFALSLLAYGLMDHGNASNLKLNQVLGLGILLIWPFAVRHLWSFYAWHRASRIWIQAFVFWWMFLAIDGWGIFLPGILEVVKFTNVLVGHSHLAMAGMVSAMNMIILIHVGGNDRLIKVLGNRKACYMWNLSCLVFVIAMTLQGWREGINPGVIFYSDLVTSGAYLTRFIAGLGMLSASTLWAALFCKEIVSSFFLAKKHRLSQPDSQRPYPQTMAENVR